MLVISATSQKSVLLTRMSDNSSQRQLAPDDSPPVSGQFAPSLWTIRPQVVCTIAVMSCVADLSSELMWNTQPIISCILSNNTQLKTGNYTPLQFGLRAKLIFRGVGHGSNIDLVITFCFERRYAAAIYKKLHLPTSILSQIDRLVSFQLQIQHELYCIVLYEKSIEDLNSGMYANRVFPASQYSTGILHSALRLPSNRSDHSVILQRQNKISEKHCN